MGKPKKTKTTTTKTEIPQWLEAGSRDAVAMGQSIANRPYEAYEGEAVAGFGRNEQEAYDMASEQAGAWEGDIGAARDQLEGIEDFTQFDQDAYMNPFIQGALDPVAREQNLRFEKNRSTMRGQQGMRNAFGNSRSAIMESELSRANEQNIGDIYSKGYAQAFDTGQQAWQRDQDRKLATAGAYQGLAQAGSQMIGADIQRLQSTGASERDIRQRQNLFDYTQFVEQRDWDVTNLQPLLDSIRNSPHGTTSTTTEVKKGGSVLGQVIGLAAVAAGVFFAPMTGGASLAMVAPGMKAATSDGD